MYKPSPFLKLILFASSYIPIFWIISLQLIEKSNALTKNEFSILHFSSWKNFKGLHYTPFVIFITILWIIIIILLLVILKFYKDDNLKLDMEIKTVNNINSNYITNYLAVYIFPFITLNMTTFDGFGTLIILVSIIGFVYIKNDILYINPILNILFGYNIYSLNITDKGFDIEIILLSKKNKSSLKTNPYISVQRIGYNVFIEL